MLRHAFDWDYCWNKKNTLPKLHIGLHKPTHLHKE